VDKFSSDRSSSDRPVRFLDAGLLISVCVDSFGSWRQSDAVVVNNMDSTTKATGTYPSSCTKSQGEVCREPLQHNTASGRSHPGLKGGQMPASNPAQFHQRRVETGDTSSTYNLPPPPGQPVHHHTGPTPLKDSAKQTWEDIKTTAGGAWFSYCS
jgi:hypothetical protein